MIAVTECSKYEELPSIRLTWRKLWEQSKEATFFQSWDWFRSYWRTFGIGKKIRVLVVSDDDQPVGVVPFILCPVRTRFGWANVVTWPLEDWGPTFGPVGPNPSATLTGAFQHLQRRNDWHAIELPHIDEQGTDRGRTRNVFKSLKMQGKETDSATHRSITLDTSWDWYCQERPPTKQRDFSTCEQELSQYGPISFLRWRPRGIHHGDTARRWDLFAQFEQAKRHTSSTMSKAEIDLAFLRDLHPVATDAGCVEMTTLTIRGRTIGCTYGFHSKGRLDLLYVGAMNEVEEEAKTVLMARLIQDSFMRGDYQIVFHSDLSELAKPWSNATVETITCSHYNILSPQAQLLKMKRNKADKNARHSNYVAALGDGAGVSTSKL